LYAEHVAQQIVTGDFETEDDGKRLEIDLHNLLHDVSATLSDLGPYGAILATAERDETVEAARGQVANLRDPEGILKDLSVLVLVLGLRAGDYTAEEVGLTADEAENLADLDPREAAGRAATELEDPDVMIRIIGRRFGATVVRLDAD